MLANPGVCVCVVSTSCGEESLNKDTIGSLSEQDYEGPIEVKMLRSAGDIRNSPNTYTCRPGVSVETVDVNLSLPGGVFLPLLQIWLNSNSKYVCYLQAGNEFKKEKISKQVKLMEETGAVGCYTDMFSYTPPSFSTPSWIQDDVYVHRAKPFDPEMIGRNCFETQTLLINRSKFIEAGGFDYALSAGYKPHTYVTAFTAVAGKIHHIPEVLFAKKERDVLKDATTLDMIDGGRDADMWKRIRFDTFVMKARGFYREREGM